MRGATDCALTIDSPDSVAATPTSNIAVRQRCPDLVMRHICAIAKSSHPHLSATAFSTSSVLNKQANTELVTLGILKNIALIVLILNSHRLDVLSKEDTMPVTCRAYPWS